MNEEEIINTKNLLKECIYRTSMSDDYFGLSAREFEELQNSVNALDNTSLILSDEKIQISIRKWKKDCFTILKKLYECMINSVNSEDIMMKTQEILQDSNTKEGTYSSVYKNYTLAIKVFKKSGNYSYEQIRKIYNSQIDAYIKAKDDIELLVHLPVFFGSMNICKIFDKNGNDISDNYHLDLNYVVEYINGNFVKYSTASENECNRIKTLFKQNGINYIMDSLVIFDGVQIVKIIDFATENHKILS